MGEHAVAKNKLWENRKYLVRKDPVGDIEYSVISPKLTEVEKPGKPFYILGTLKSGKQTIFQIGYVELQKRGFVIVSVKADQPWFKHQTKRYLISRKDRIPYRSERKVLMPSNHKIIYDKAGRRFRLEGRNAGPGGLGDWFYE